MANILNVREDASHEWTAIEAIQGPPGEPGPGAEIVEFTLTPESMTEFTIEASHTPAEVEALIEDGKFVMAVMDVTGLGIVRALPSVLSGNLAFFMQVVGGTSSEGSSVEIMSGHIFANDDEWTCEIYDNTVVNENQGSENAGKVMTVDNDGTVVPKAASGGDLYMHFIHISSLYTDINAYIHVYFTVICSRKTKFTMQTLAQYMDGYDDTKTLSATGHALNAAGNKIANVDAIEFRNLTGNTVVVHVSTCDNGTWSDSNPQLSNLSISSTVLKVS